ncbi:MAG: type I-E CRISPR-associated protein Cse2/CasB [Elusimicrobia bacterium]|nr:type I-E CRISPR-associated protein Cse2/CasB [Elusimicrobiota bacterium]
MSNLLTRLRSYNKKDDRGIMANLRCILVDNKKHRAWPALNRLGVDIKDDVSAFVAGLFATHHEEISIGNFGNTCKAIEQSKGETRSDNKLTPTERRFQHLLTAKKGHELRERVLRMVLMAKSKGVPVNYVQLETDLKFWNDHIKTEWATDFWAQNANLDTKEDI